MQDCFYQMAGWISCKRRIAKFFQVVRQELHTNSRPDWSPLAPCPSRGRCARTATAAKCRQRGYARCGLGRARRVIAIEPRLASAGGRHASAYCRQQSLWCTRTRRDQGRHEDNRGKRLRHGSISPRREDLPGQDGCNQRTPSSGLGVPFDLRIPLSPQ